MNDIVRKLESLLDEAGGVDKSISCYSCGVNPSCKFTLSYGSRLNRSEDRWDIQVRDHEFGGWVDIRTVRSVNEREELVSRLCPSCVKSRLGPKVSE